MQASYAAQGMQPEVDARLNQPTLVRGPVITLQRDSNYLLGHGSYIADWVYSEPHAVQETRIFEQMMLLSDTQVRNMIAERIAGIDPAHLSNMWVPQEERDRLSCLDVYTHHWMRPSNKEFVLIQNDGYRYCYGIYAHFFKNYLIRGETKRIEAFEALRKSRGQGGNERLGRALRGEF